MTIIYFSVNCIFHKNKNIYAPEGAHAHICQRQMCLNKNNYRRIRK